MIPRANITGWRSAAPWPEDGHVEQDLVLARALVQLYPRPRFAEAAVEVAALAHKQCRPLANIPGDADYRREMVPVYVKRTLLAAANGSGPVHHV